MLNLAGNPICSDHQYEYNVIAFLENLVYLDYKYINEEKRQKASDQFHDEVDDYRNTHEAG